MFLFIFSLKEKTAPPDAGLQTFHKTKLLDDFRVTSKFFGGQVKATLKINFRIGVLYQSGTIWQVPNFGSQQIPSPYTAHFTHRHIIADLGNRLCCVK